MEYLPDQDRLVLRAGVGWKDGYIGQYQVSLDTNTPIGYAFSFSEPVPITDDHLEKRYHYPTILTDHGCVASLMPPPHGYGNFGVL
jgi:hypothetical protein